VIKNAHNLGYAGNMNVLFKSAKGEYLIIQDADDYCAVNRLQVLVDYLETFRYVDMVGSSYVKVDEKGEEQKTLMSDNLAEIEVAFKAMVDPLPVLNGSVMFRRKIIDAGFFFRDLEYVNRAQDDDWLFRISEKYTLANVSDYLYYYRFNPASMTMNLSSINYFSLFSGDYVRFLKKVRMQQGIDLLQQGQRKTIEDFFLEKKREITQQQAAHLEIYVAHKYLSFDKRTQAIKWLIKALLKDPGNAFIWKKIVFILLRKRIEA
jgi:glycosyltransferase involved in cell wall biosynthesis